MMTSPGAHLTETEFVDLFDGTLPAVRRQHVDGCAACADQAAEFAATAGDAAQADVPEPPPFFWTQFSARVSEAVAREAATPALARFGWVRASWLAAAASIAVILVSVFALRNAGDQASVAAPSPALERAGADAGLHSPADEALDLESDEAWALVRALAEDMDEQQMDDEGVSTGAGAAERLTQQLTDAERIELARLIQEQLRLAGVSESVS